MERDRQAAQHRVKRTRKGTRRVTCARSRLVLWHIFTAVYFPTTAGISILGSYVARIPVFALVTFARVRRPTSVPPARPLGTLVQRCCFAKGSRSPRTPRTYVESVTDWPFRGGCLALDIIPYATLTGTPSFDDDGNIMEEKLLMGAYEIQSGFPTVCHIRCLALLSTLTYFQQCAA